jgi:hypothetical protein
VGAGFVGSGGGGSVFVVVGSGMELRAASDALGETAREGVCPGAAEATDGSAVGDGWLPVFCVPAVQPTNEYAKQRAAEARMTGM